MAAFVRTNTGLQACSPAPKAQPSHVWRDFLRENVYQTPGRNVKPIVLEAEYSALSSFLSANRRVGQLRLVANPESELTWRWLPGLMPWADVR